MSTEIRGIGLRELEQGDQVAHVRQSHSNCIKLASIITGIAMIVIPIFITTIAYVVAFKAFKLSLINQKLTLALKIIVPATLGLGIVLIEVPLYIASLRNLKKRNSLHLNTRLEEIGEDIDMEDLERINPQPLHDDEKRHILSFLSAKFVLETMRLVSHEWKDKIVEAGFTANMIGLRDYPDSMLIDYYISFEEFRKLYLVHQQFGIES